MRVLIDCDIFRYQHGSIQIQHPFLKTKKLPARAETICELVDQTIKDIIKATGADEYVCVLSGKGNFRHDIAKQQPYKGNRSLPKPPHYHTVGDHIFGNYPYVLVEGYEADDWMGIEQRKDPENTCISSRDKDLKTVYGYHHRFACGEKQPEVPMHWMSEFESLYFFFYQLLIGDTTDNIPGCGVKEEMMWGGKLTMRRKGIGPKGAITILKECNTAQDMYTKVSEAYKEQFGEEYEEVLLEQARLLYIGQTPDNMFDWSWINMEITNGTELLPNH